MNTRLTKEDQTMIKETGEILEYEPMSFDQVKVMNNTEEM